MIKEFRELNEDEIREVQLYLNCLDKNDKSIQQIKEEFNAKIYNFGEGILFYFMDNKVVGSVKVVLEAIKHLSAAYIYSLNIANNLENEVNIVRELLSSAINLVECKKCSKILLGARDEKILKLFNEFGYIPSYNSYKMKLDHRKTTSEPLELINLSEENKEEYLTVINNSFSDIPHGCYYEMEDIENYLNDNSENRYYLVSDNNKLIGFMNIEIDNKVGSFDIGLCKDFRGIGYGKRLLETAIYTLNRANVDKVTLTVIEKNSVAFNMYLKRGFVIDNIINYWIEIR
jgi:ribosomal protein S18 acetylase RimI-like enzyme